MKVLSLFDGISTGMVALERAGILVEEYYASEIDKYAIQIAKKNYPNIIQLGDINNWSKWDIDWGDIDLIIGGSPCQGFSNAGKCLNFDDPRSKLFFIFIDILNHIKKVNSNIIFLFENVKMKKEWANIISKHIGVEPIELNSSLFSAQNRRRLYWTNIKVNTEIKNKSSVVLKDIYREEDNELYHLSKKHYLAFLKSYKWKPNCLNEKSKTILASYYKQPPHCPYIPCEKSPSGFRMLSPVECERLQTLPDNYTNGISKTQRYKCLGNAWTADVIAYIFKYINNVS